jgi:hypothetical protein
MGGGIGVESTLGTILLVEDNEDDVLFMKRALRAASIANPVPLVEDGQQAIDYSGRVVFGETGSPRAFSIG